MANASPVVKQDAPSPWPNEQQQAELFASDPLLSALGLASDLWADEHADEYVARLRKDW